MMRPVNIDRAPIAQPQEWGADRGSDHRTGDGTCCGSRYRGLPNITILIVLVTMALAPMLVRYFRPS